MSENSSNDSNTDEIMQHQSQEIEEIEDSFLNLYLKNKDPNKEEEEQQDIINIFLTQVAGSEEEMTISTVEDEKDKNGSEEEQEYRGSLVGYSAETWEEIYEAYQKHAKAIGFSIRKSTTRYTQGNNKKVRAKEFVCSRQGFRCNTNKSTPKLQIQQKTPTQKQQNKQPRKRKQVALTRTGCQAYLRVKVNQDSTWEVDEHVIAHNHELAKRQHHHLHRSERKITQEKSETIDMMLESGLKPVEDEKDKNGSEEEQEYRGSLVGYSAETWEEIYEAYQKHAKAIGFSIRKSTTRYTQGNNKKVRAKEFVCSRQGFRCNTNKSTPKLQIQQKTPTQKQQNKQPRKRKQVALTRTGSQAYLRVKVNQDSTWEVDEHVIAHNHELAKRQHHHLHRSERKITQEKSETIDMMLESGLKPSQTYNLMAHEAGGQELLGDTIIDHFNYISRKKMKEIEGGDAQNVIDSLYQRQSDDPEYFFRFKLGATEMTNKLTTIFWRDSEMMEDYKIYGDVVIFDITFRTNKYNLICAPIVGINNHWQTVMFACAFIADETEATFQWVLNTLKKSMGGLEQTSIFTDQDLAMSKAIQKVFPNTRHRLCIWHLIKNAVSRFGALKRNAEFKKAFNKCLRGCITREEFEECWNEMIKDYNLENSKWFDRLYKLKEKWCTTLSKDFFSAGILSSQRSESTNNAIGFKAKKSTSLTDFFKIFDQTIKRWRRKEMEEDYKCANSEPNSTLPMKGLIKHAMEVYTQTLYREFEAEYTHEISCLTTCIAQIGTIHMYEVWIEDKEYKKQMVTYNSSNNLVECSCKNYEEVGWLCYHCIRILLQHSVTKIPEDYILKRWTREAKAEYWKKRENEKTETEIQQDKYIPWRSVMARKGYNLILKSQQYKETRQLLEENYNKMITHIDQIILQKLQKEKQQEEAEKSTEQEAQNQIPIVQDPDRANTKGRSKRIKGFFDTTKQPKQKKTKAMTAQAEGREFGTITPIQKPTLIQHQLLI